MISNNPLKRFLLIATISIYWAYFPSYSAAESSPEPIPFGIAATPSEGGSQLEGIVLTKQATDIVAIPSLWFNVLSGDITTCNDMISPIRIAQRQNMQVMVRFEASVLGQPAVPPELGKSSFGNPNVIQAYLQQMACFAYLKPEYMVLGPEINFAYRLNRTEFDFYADLYKQAYALIKSLSPDTRVGVSYQYLSMLNFNEWEAVDLIGPQDFIGFTKYFAITIDRFIKYPGPWSLPNDFFSPIREHFPDTPVVFTEYAWSSFFSEQGELMQSELLLNTQRLMATVQPELIVWAALQDIEEFGEVFDAVNSVGLRLKDAGSTPKPAWFYLQLLFSNGNFLKKVTIP